MREAIRNLLLLAFVAVSPYAQGENGTSDERKDFDPDASAPLTFKVDDRTSLGAKWNLELDGRVNKDLDSSASDAHLVLVPEVSLSGLYHAFPRADVFGEIEISSDLPLVNDADERAEKTELVLKRLYVEWKDAIADDVDLMAGRQRMKDAREWLYDEDLDAVKLTLSKGPVEVELWGGAILIDADDDEDDLSYVTLRGTYHYGRKSRIALYTFLVRDRSDKERNPDFLGLSWYSESKHKAKHWCEAALVMGEEEGRELSGYGFDVGTVVELDGGADPSVTLGLAYGSGDGDPGRTDGNFQQTDLQDNNGKFNGNTKFKYYGEALDPELSNMIIFTLGLGAKPAEDLSLDLVYHYYRLVETSDELRDADVNEDLTGEDKELGHAVDLIVGTRLGERVRFAASVGVLSPGRAFPQRDLAWSGEAKFQYTF